MMHRRLGLAALVSLVQCNHANAPTDARPDATVSTADAAAAHAGHVSTAPPENLLMSLRGSSLRRAVPLAFAQPGIPEVLEQLSRQVTPGIADHGDEIDVDSPFAVAGTVTGDTESTLTLFVAWPLRPGMQVAQQARSGHGYRTMGEGLYAPDSPDAGANAANQCWVAQRRPVGWMLLCGPREGLAATAGFLQAQANDTPENNAVIDLDVRAGTLRRLLNRQLAELDEHTPPRADGGIEGARRAAFEDTRRTAAVLTAITNDMDSLHVSVTQDENAMHLRGEMLLARTSSDTTRALIAGAAGRQADTHLMQLLPASVSAFIAGGFDRAQLTTAMGAATLDPGIAMQAGPELARVMNTLDTVKDLLPLGERVDAYLNDDPPACTQPNALTPAQQATQCVGWTSVHVVRRPDAAQFVSDLRVAINSIPSRPLPDGTNLRDVRAIMPTPGLTGTNVLRVGQNVHIPAGAQVPPEIRAALERSMLLVADGDHVIAIAARDPIARYRALSQGPRLAATIPANAVMAGQVTSAAFAPLFYGTAIPGLPPAHATEPLSFALRVERRGEGAHASLEADAPIGTATEIRGFYSAIQELQARMAQQMMQQQRAMQQGGAAAGGMRPQGRPQRPQLDPSMLPEPPHLQLQPPR